jgi:hypothetical protein
VLSLFLLLSPLPNRLYIANLHAKIAGRPKQGATKHATNHGTRVTGSFPLERAPLFLLRGENRRKKRKEERKIAVRYRT